MTILPRCKAHAKLNLTLDVKSKRPDGYHEMEMIMTSVKIGDEIDITLGTGSGFALECDMEGVPTDDSNLALMAAKNFFGDAGIDPGGVLVKISKSIPPGSGMAGGSSDAAAVLNALNRHYGCPLSDQQLLKLGLALGSDVPYCLTGGTVIATGRGEIMTPLANLPPCYIVICRPDFAVSTKHMFDKLDDSYPGDRKGRPYDTVDIKSRNNTAAAAGAINSGDLRRLGKELFNVFEQVLDKPEINEIKQTLIENGALGASMTGTGSAVYGIFDAEEKARNCEIVLLKQYQKVFLTNNV